MTKRNETPTQIFRLNSSEYFPKDFISKEKKSFKALSLRVKIPLKYCEKVEQIHPSWPLILLTNSQGQLSYMPSYLLQTIKLIIHPNSGYDNFPLELVENAPGPIIVGNPIRANAVAEYILSQLFRHFAPVPNQKKWNPKRQFERELLSQQGVLILGHGAIGSKLVQVLQPLVREISCYDPYRLKNTLPLHLRKFRVVIVATGLNPSSKNLVDAAFLRQLPSNFVLINAARGECVSQKALLGQLSKRPKAHAYLDVYPREPADFSQLQHLDNLTTTSHIAGVYRGLPQAVIDFETQVAENFLKMTSSQFNRHYRQLNLKNRIHRDQFLI